MGSYGVDKVSSAACVSSCLSRDSLLWQELTSDILVDAKDASSGRSGRMWKGESTCGMKKSSVTSMAKRQH
jgi:hypothetical protein